MKLHVKQNIDHYIKDMFADILSAQSRMKSEIEYEGLFQIVAAELRAAKYCWDELFKRAEDTTQRLLANEYEIALRSKVAALMHSANILVETEHMVEQEYPFPSTEFILEVTLREMREEFDQLTDIITKTLHSREIYQRNKILKDFFLLWDGGRHMHAFE
ncbi:MAG: hypothetical protein AB1640_07685 [bacterium]